MINLNLELQTSCRFKFLQIIANIAMHLILLVLVETVQFLTFNGSTDIDDIILNYVGALVGYGISKVILAKIKLDEE